MPIRQFRFLIFPPLFLTAILSCGSSEEDLIRRTQFIMGTLVEIIIREPSQVKAQLALSSAFDEMRRLEKLMSTHLPDSEISRLNAEADGKNWQVVSQEVLEVIKRGIHWGNRSDGAFDISIFPVSSLWRFDDDNPFIPDAQRLVQAVGLVNFREVEIDGTSIRLKQPGMSLHLGAIAKGYAVDKAMAVLQKNGIRHALINAGGDLKAIGQRKDGQPWSIGLQHPRQPEKLIASIALSKKAVATSGDYQKYFMKENVRYHHILDPATGMPVKGVISSTIVANSVMDADALATAVFVLGPEKGMALVDSLDGVEGMLVTESGDTLFSKNFESQSGFVFQGLNDDSAH